MKPKISVIVPVYKAEAYIHHCIDSILAQTFTDFELILVNDGSPDRCGIICNEYAQRDSRIKVIHKENGGVASARQCAMDLATGIYTIHVDPDDWISTDMFEALYGKAISDSSDIVICDIEVVLPQHTIREHINPPLEKEELISRLFTGGVHGSLCNKLIKLDLYKNNGIKFIEGIDLSEDLMVLYKLVYYSQKITYVPEFLYHYRKDSPNSLSAQSLSSRYQKNRVAVLVDIAKFIETHEFKSNNVSQCHKYMIAGLRGEILFNGQIDDMSFFRSKSANLRLKDITGHPNIASIYKIMTILDFFRLTPFIWLIRLLKKIKQKYRNQ